MTVRQELAASVLTDLLFDEPGVGRCLVAPDGTVLRANPEWLRSTGYALEDVLGTDVIDLFPETRDLALALHARARAGHRVEVPRHAQRVHGRETWWQGTIAPVPMEGGTGLLVTAREVGRAAPGDDGAGPSRELLASVVAHAQTCIAVVSGPELRFTLVNPAYQAIAPGTPMLGRTYGEVFPEAAASGSRARFLHVLDTGEPWEVDAWRAPTPGKPDATWRGRVVRLPPAPFEPPSALVVIEDITAQTRAEVALRGEEEKYRSLFEHSVDAVYLARRDGTIVDANRAACELHGMTLEEIRRAGREGLVVTDARHAAALEARDAAGHVRAEMAVRRKDGTTVPVEVESVLLEPGRPDSPSFVISRDISLRRRAEEALRESAARSERVLAELRSAVERYERQVRLFEGVASTTPDFVYLFDREGRFLYANRRLLDVWGMSLPDVVGKTCLELGYERWHHDMHMREIADVIARRRAIKGEVPFKAPLTGVFGIYEYIFTPVLGPDGEVEIVAGTTRDVTDRKRVEEALRNSQQLLRSTMDNFPTVIAFKDREGRFLDVNPVVERALGLPKERIVGRTIADFVPAEAAEVLHRRDAEVMASRRAAVVEEVTPLPTGTLHHLDVNFPLVDAEGRVYGTGHISHDITEVKRAEVALREANERLREADRRKDEFLGMLSHELRNPLAPIRNSSYVLRHTPPGSEAAARAQAVIERQTEHLTRIVDDLLDVTRIARGKIELRRSRVDLREVVSRAAEDFRVVMRDRSVDLEVAIPEAPIWADVDPTRLTQVIGNLLHNASKFTRRGDRVAVSVSSAGEAAELRVRDTGAGIEPELLPTMFEPFVQGARTLARSEGGLGLGLALVKGIAELHGGAVRAESEGGGKGSEFVVTLPVAAAASGPDRGAAGRTPGAGRRRVLVVDDNADAAESLGDLLAMLGHAVDVAYDGPSALEKARASPPEVVLCDLGLPGMTGYDVARALRGIAPAARLVALSGYAQPEDVDRAVEAGFHGHVAKPADPAALERLLAR